MLCLQKKTRFYGGRTYSMEEEKETIIREGEYKGESTVYYFYTVMPDLFLLAQIILAKLSALSTGGLRFALGSKENEVGLT